MGRLLSVVCASVMLASCAAPNYQGDPEATKIAENQYTICLTEAAAQLDDRRSEAAAIAPAVAVACKAQFVQIQIADGDQAREEFQSVYSPASAELMHKQDSTQQTFLATQAVESHRHLAANAAISGDASAQPTGTP